MKKASATLVLALLGTASAGACGSPTKGTCDETATCPPEPDAGGVVVPADCDLTKSLKDSPGCVVDSVGIFVSASGADGATGSKAAPVKTIGKGVELAASRGLPRVYVCDGTYDSNVEIKGAVSLYGGLSCAWAYTGAKPKLAPPKGVALRVSKVAGAVLIEDLDVTGSADPNTAGDPAIAALVTESADVRFRNDVLSAGVGTAGAKGADRTNYADPVATKGGNFSGTNGGVGPTCTCTDATSSTGGNGGAGGGGGLTNGSANPPVGDANSGASKATSCDPGLLGANGLAAPGGQAPTSAGTLSASGWSSSAAPVNAPNGKPAQGGGGGGTKLDSSSPGGAGGCGGCGGAGGASGGAGGASFSLLVFSSGVTVDGGTLSSATGGAGGAGAAGQDGQGGGAGGTGAACNGGGGGAGAGGSGGGGGAGGHSAPIAFVGTEPKVNGATLTPGTKGTGGAGGAGGAGPGNAGAAGATGPDGKSQNTLAL